jgi:ATP-binding cassette, subfamily B, bacterial PglK
MKRHPRRSLESATSTRPRGAPLSSRRLILLASRADRVKLALLLGLMLLGACLETIGVGLTMPFIALLMDPGRAGNSTLLAEVQRALGLDTEREVMLAACLALLGVFVIKNAFLLFLQWYKYHFAFEAQVRLARRLFSAYLNGPYSFFASRNSAEILRNVNEEVRNVFNHVVIPSLTLVVEGMVALGMVIVMTAAAPVAAPFAIVLLIGTALSFYAIVRKKSALLGRERQLRLTEMIQWVRQGVGGIKEAKVLGCEDFFVRSFDHSSRRYADASRHQAVVTQAPVHFIETVGVAGLILLICFWSAMGERPSELLPTLSVFAMAAVRLLPSFNRSVSALTGIRHHRPSLDVVVAELERLAQPQPQPTLDSPNPSGEPVFTRELRFSHVSFTYPGTDTPAVDDVSFLIEKGSSVALVGPSGSGKSTLLDLLLGLQEVSRGSVTVDGRPLADVAATLRSKIGYIPQHVFLLDDSLRNNVAFGQDASQIRDEDVWLALEAAQLRDFVQRQPEGLGMRIGENGARMSGGERQRLGIARALYRRPEFLIFDEATSSLDNETERDVSAAIERLRGQRTMLVIAHRLATVERCDQILMIAAGRVVAFGSYAELIQKSPEFKSLVASGLAQRSVPQMG